MEIQCLLKGWGFPGGSDSKVNDLPANAGEVGSTPRLGRPPGEGNGNPLHYSCLINPMDRGAWWATVHGVAESDTTERLEFFSLFGELKSHMPWGQNIKT